MRLPLCRHARISRRAGQATRSSAPWRADAEMLRRLVASSTSRARAAVTALSIWWRPRRPSASAGHGPLGVTSCNDVTPLAIAASTCT